MTAAAGTHGGRARTSPAVFVVRWLMCDLWNPMVVCSIFTAVRVRGVTVSVATPVRRQQCSCMVQCLAYRQAATQHDNVPAPRPARPRGAARSATTPGGRRDAACVCVRKERDDERPCACIVVWLCMCEMERVLYMCVRVCFARVHLCESVQEAERDAVARSVFKTFHPLPPLYPHHSSSRAHTHKHSSK